MFQESEQPAKVVVYTIIRKRKDVDALLSQLRRGLLLTKKKYALYCQQQLVDELAKVKITPKNKERVEKFKTFLADVKDRILNKE